MRLGLGLILPLGIAIFWTFLGVFPSEARERASVVYNVSNIDLDATASTAVRARAAAILYGHGLALSRLLRRLTLPEDWHRLPRLSGNEAQRFSIGYSMTKERNSATRYQGFISVRFVPLRVQTLLEDNNIPFGDIQTSAALVVPVYDLPNGRRLVWDNQNIWRDAWGRPDISESLTPFTLPVGDIEDIIALPEKKANLRSRRNLFALAKRYKASRILLAHAKLEKVNWKGKSGYALNVRLNLLSEQDNPDSDEVMRFSTAGKSKPQDLLEGAVDDVLRMTGIAWKRRVIVHHGEMSTHEVEVQFNSLLEWQRLRAYLDDIPVIRDYQILRLDNQGALLKFNFSGTEEILTLALKQKNIEFITSEDIEEPWKLRLLK